MKKLSLLSTFHQTEPKRSVPNLLNSGPATLTCFLFPSIALGFFVRLK